MAVSRTVAVDTRFREHVSSLPTRSLRTDLDSPVKHGTSLSARDALRLFEAQIESRLLDLVSRELKVRNESFYTIGSSGHEGNAAVAGVLRSDDPAFLHYRSGGFYLARANATPGPEGAFDVLLGVVASSDEPIAGGRHKVFGSTALAIPPQTSTIASQLPKALGCAIAMDRKARLQGYREQRIAVCSFGDASVNHASATTALNAASWTSFQRLPAPVLFVCEDNGLGISVRTPEGWVAAMYGSRPGMPYFYGDGLDLPHAWDAAKAAATYVRQSRRPAFLHLRTVRLLGHAGSDVEQAYRTVEEIEAAEALDPVLRTAVTLIEGGWLAPDDVIALYDDTGNRLRALAEEAVRRPKITTRAETVRALHPPVTPISLPAADPARREEVHGELPEQSDRKRHLAFQINRALGDVLAAVPEAIVFGEDVARKGGVYHVTAGLAEKMRVGRVFNTLLDETSILGLAIGAGHAGLLPIPEIQYLAYLMNAIDQLRGEAGSMQFFSNGQYANPMVVRIASFAYQKGFGGHFHNDNGIAALREVPGLLLGTPSRGDDAARMLRTMVGMAREQGRVCVMLEPIALYMTRDLHEPGDGEWLTLYPSPEETLPTDAVGVTTYGTGADLCIASYANGLWMSLRVARRLHEALGVGVRVLDLRWLNPLPLDALAPHAARAGKLLVVDECRASSGIADTVVADISERHPEVQTARVTGADTYIPLGAAANLVLVQEHDIDAAARSLLSGGAR
jgi:2-oxoisovalerate dehydrogenase E1 component